MSGQKTENTSRSCPKCRSTSLQTETIYDWDDGLADEIALFCVNCGYFMGEFPSDLRGKGENLHGRLLGQMGQSATQNNLSEIESFLWGRHAATADFD